MSTTKQETFSVRDRARWLVNEECKYRCPKCGTNSHRFDEMLSTTGYIAGVYTGRVYCTPCRDAGRGEVEIPLGEHIYEFIPTNGFMSPSIELTRLAPDELEHLS